VKLDQRRAPAAAALVAELVRAHRRVTVEHAVDDAPQRAGALAVHDPHGGQTRLLGGADVLGDDIGALPGQERVEIDLGGERHVDRTAGRLVGWLAGLGAQIGVDVVEIGAGTRRAPW
jgi:hypothetical protein